MIKLEGIRKSFGSSEILKGIDLTVEEGETVALIGASGSGKSTLLRCINLLETPDAGSIQIGDYRFDAQHISRQVRGYARRHTAMVFQTFGLFENKTALENVTEALIVVQKKSRKQAEEIGMDYLGQVGLADHASYYPSGLSGGQKQRVAIARALSLKPQIILFDEPTSALDPELVQEVLNVIRNVARSHVTMLIVTHEMDFARDVSDKIAFMYEGSILECSSPEKLFMHPENERTKQFLDYYLQRFVYYI